MRSKKLSTGGAALLLLGTFALGCTSSAPTSSAPTSSAPALEFDLCFALAISSRFPPIDLEGEVDDFVQSIPFSGGYADPTQGKIPTRDAIVSAFKEAREGNLFGACSILGNNNTNYSIQKRTDTHTNRRLILIRENRDRVNGAYPLAWGLYVIAWPPADNSSKLTVEVPHGCPDQASPACTRGDIGTHLVGVRAFRAANAHYLFINGADRAASGVISDMTRQTESLFEKIHEAAVFEREGGFGSSTRVYQPHGFAAANHDGVPPPDGDDKALHVNWTGGPEPANPRTVGNVVVSNGRGGRPVRADPYPTQLAKNVATALHDAGFAVCLFLGSTQPPSDPNDCADLGATNNEQGKAIRHNDPDISNDEGEFVHVEAESLLNANQADLLATTVAQAMM